jgi:hypothetical protein
MLDVGIVVYLPEVVIIHVIRHTIMQVEQPQLKQLVIVGINDLTSAIITRFVFPQKVVPTRQAPEEVVYYTIYHVQHINGRGTDHLALHRAVMH